MKLCTERIVVTGTRFELVNALGDALEALEESPADEYEMTITEATIAFIVEDDDKP